MTKKTEKTDLPKSLADALAARREAIAVVDTLTERFRQVEADPSATTLDEVRALKLQMQEATAALVAARCRADEELIAHERSKQQKLTEELATAAERVEAAEKALEAAKGVAQQAWEERRRLHDRLVRSQRDVKHAERRLRMVQRKSVENALQEAAEVAAGAMRDRAGVA